MKRSLSFVVFLLVISSLLIACTAEPETIEVTRVVTETVVQEGQTVEVTRVVTEEVETAVEVTRVVTEVEEVVVEATPVPVDRNGGWLDTIIFVEEPNQDAGVARLAAGDIDMYADDIGGQAAVQAIADAGNITTRVQYGLYDEIFFNNGACSDDGTLNPFNTPKIHEAMNWAIDRDYVADELYGGLAVPKYTAISEAGADRARFAPEIRAIEAKYAYDFDKAYEVISSEMEALGAVMEGGLWTYAGEPVNLVILIRIEDTRLEIGNYVGNQLEEMGFTVERVERTSGELAPIWQDSDPAACEWNLYTGAWSQNQVDRSSVDNFDDFYTPRGTPWASWQVLAPAPELDELALRLYNSDFVDLEERSELVARVFPLAAENAARVWVTSRTTLVPFSDEVSVTTDLAAGVSGAAIWPKTIRFAGELGGSMTIGLPSVFTQPWNPIGGSNWVFDGMVQRGASDTGVYDDPHTGLKIPNRVERAEVVAQEGFPMGVTLDWVDLSFAPEIVVPDDAWADWDSENQVFITAGEKYTETQTAVFKSTVYYPADMYDTVTWHDGSPISAADFVIGMILKFDLAKEASPYYDPSLVPDLQQFQAGFKAFRIISTDPLVIEHYGDDAQLDAENTVYDWFPVDGIRSAYSYGDAAWHNMAIMLRGEGNGGFSFTAAKAEANENEQTNMLSGPSLEIWAAELAAAIEEEFIPYAPTLGQFVSAEEAVARYENLTEFARRYGHYYIGLGAYFLQGVFPIEGQAILAHYDAYPDPANRWDRFSAPAMAEVEIDGPSRVSIGEEAIFDVYVDMFGGPYLAADIDSIAYLLFDATNTQVASGSAVGIEDGLWEIALSSDVTSALAEGSNRLEVVVASKLVALPSLGEYQFVTAP